MVFDHHQDALELRCGDKLRRIRADGCTTSRRLELCDKHLRALNDDWIWAAMELGLVDNAVVFGVEDRDSLTPYVSFNDHVGKGHQIFFLGFVRDGLDHKGTLSDLARHDEFAPICGPSPTSSAGLREVDDIAHRVRMLMGMPQEVSVVTRTENIVKAANAGCLP